MKKLIGLVGLLLISCSKPQVIPNIEFYQLQRNEIKVEDGYLTQKMETIIRKKMDKIFEPLPENKNYKGLNYKIKVTK